MIRNGNGGMSPLIRPFHDILGFRYPVHIAHFGMAVQLHTLADAVIHTAMGKITDFLHADDRADGQLPVELIYHGNSLDFHEYAGLDALTDFLHLFVFGKHLNRHGIGKVRDIKNKDGSFILDFPLVQIQDFAADGHLSYFTHNILNGHGLVIKIPAIDHIRIIGTLRGLKKIAVSLKFAFPAAEAAGLFAHKLFALQRSAGTHCPSFKGRASIFGLLS